MTPIKLTSTSLDASEVVVMFDKITHIESAKTAFGDEFTRVHLGSDMVEVKETPDEVFKMLALVLHDVDLGPTQNPSLMAMEDDAEVSEQKKKPPTLSTETLIKESDERYGERNNL